VLTFDAPALQRFWLADYCPEVIAVEQARFPTLDQVTSALARGSAEVRVEVVPVPCDRTDGFGEAFYARPEAFLRPEVRAATSGLVLSDPGAMQRGLDRLQDHLANGGVGPGVRTRAPAGRAPRRPAPHHRQHLSASDAA